MTLGSVVLSSTNVFVLERATLEIFKCHPFEYEMIRTFVLERVTFEHFKCRFFEYEYFHTQKGDTCSKYAKIYYLKLFFWTPDFLGS